MENNRENSKDTLLARWLSGGLTDEEKKALESSGDNKILEKIITNVDQWTLPELKADYQSLKNKLAEERRTKVVPMYRNKTVMSVAASLLLLIGLSVSYFLFSSKPIVYQCAAGQKLDVYLPDQTHVILNGYSSISFDEKEWASNRELRLEGEAYFEVVKKGPFKVKFEKGDVDVLGTRFNIMSGKDIATVRCYEGKVAVTTEGIAQQILTKGMGIRLSGAADVDSFSVKSSEPDWQKGESTFADAPLIEVINSLSIQFNTPFDINNSVDLTRKYTGKFVHSDLNSALNMVFTPMGIQYSVEGEKRKTVTIK